MIESEDDGATIFEGDAADAASAAGCGDGPAR